MGGVGTILGGLSAYSEAGKSAVYADTMRRNAVQKGRNNAYLERLEAARKASAKVAAYGAQGVDVNQGTPVSVLSALDADGEVSALHALYAGESESMEWNIRKKTAEQRGRRVLTGSGFNLLNPVLGGSGTLWGNYLSSGGGRFMGQQ